MRIEQTRFCAENDGWGSKSPGTDGLEASLVLVFGSTGLLSDPQRIVQVRRAYPGALLFGCSTAGEIHDTRVYDDSLTVTAIQFEKTRVSGGEIAIDGPADSYSAGEQLAAMLDGEGLAHVLVLSDGLHVNGSELVQGLTQHLPGSVSVTGGLAGDGGRFEETLVLWDGIARSKTVAAVGLYGSNLKVGCGSLGGWDPFGPDRLITRSKGNVLYELDGRPALDLYKSYLGEHAAGLPATGLLFPLSVRNGEHESGVVRTILSIDEQEGSLIFAGDVPEGSYGRLMKANFDRLIDGAIGAATTCHEAIGHSTPDLALLISCVGRKMVLKQRIEEEVEGVLDVLGAGAIMTGFYSYGEISPFTPGAKCELHNQTMTITTLAEQ